jgi:hypothetical protein
MLPKRYVRMSITPAKLRTKNALILWPKTIAMGAPKASFTFALNARGCWPFPLPLARQIKRSMRHSAPS